MSDRLLRAVNRPIALRIVVAVTSELCRTAATRHETSPAVSCALGRGLSGGLLLATLTKGGERVTLQFDCDGPLRGLTVDAYDDGDVRGYPKVPDAGAGMVLSGHQRLEPLVGHNGILNVTRDIGTFSREARGAAVTDRYQGQVRLSTGEIDEDIESYLRNSEQVPSALGCDVVLDQGGQVLRAGGLLLQVLPGGDEDRIRAAQHALRTGALYQALLHPEVTPQSLCAAVLPDLEIEFLDERPLRFQCRCSEERIESMLSSLPRAELDEMIVEGRAEVICNYCNEKYQITVETLARIRHAMGPAGPGGNN